MNKSDFLSLMLVLSVMFVTATAYKLHITSIQFMGQNMDILLFSASVLLLIMFSLFAALHINKIGR